MFDAQAPHRQREVNRNQCAVIVGAERLRLSERIDQPRQYGQNRIRASVRKTQRQQSSATVINYAQQRVGFDTNRDVRPIQRPGLDFA